MLGIDWCGGLASDLGRPKQGSAYQPTKGLLRCSVSRLCLLVLLDLEFGQRRGWSAAIQIERKWRGCSVEHRFVLSKFWSLRGHVVGWIAELAVNEGFSWI